MVLRFLSFSLLVVHKGRHQLAQVVAYALAVEETLKVTVDEAVMISVNGGLTRFKITPWLRNWIINELGSLRSMINRQELPKPTIDKAKCSACFYRSICLKYG
ncbi:CRISPR-associated protein Cas4 [Caldivirga maquilingensis]|uniref:DUF83 domain-containing protein n=1 Tax=Caldivirga maquilingensis (strain ATCC 700844 / DSM 13496 / JCM 10307 / IC-167) TaxID=397948 RepID=A8M9A7_CALMQ|nr:Dna2/Cas4 domain-containing protein [Caldivirga maquilingensis]ABW02326.1 hypothetical protein Cmaq_1502 [Caldivirga maquilingensis IC-167]